MALRAKKPEAIQKRLKLFMFGTAGVGKTTAAIQFPKSYIIDCERGTEHYDKLINASGSAVFQTTDMQEIIQEVKSLLTEKHDYTTVVVDPITTVYGTLLEKHEKRVGTEMGRHYNEAAKDMKRLINLLMQLDMNVIVTSHAKTEYGPKMEKVGETFDGYKKLDYTFDLVLELNRRKGAKERSATVRKTRLEAFPDAESFPWSYQEFVKRYGQDMLERTATTIALASDDQVKTIKDLLSVVKIDDDMIQKWFTKASVDAWEDMPSDTIVKCIEFVKAKLPKAAA